MSELVERHMESMAEEIEEMRRIKLFTIEEIRVIIKKRKQLEYKINGLTKTLQDFKNYIQYEKILLRAIKLRRDKFRLADGKSNIEHKILKRIKQLYEIALQRFSNDLPLCLAYFKFCKEANYNRPASLIVQNMIKNFSQNPEVWQVAAAWYTNTDMNQALNVIHKGLTLHKDCKVLYTEAIQLELLHMEKEDWAKDAKGKTKDQVCCERVNAYIQAIFKNINDFNFLLEILKLLEPHNFTKSIQDTIIKKLLECNFDEELVWDALAQRENEGYHYDTSEEEIKKTTKYRLNKCFKKYKEGLSKIPKNKKGALWELYLNYLVELQQDTHVANVLKKQTLLTALDEASKEITLDDKYFIVWTKYTTSEAEIVEILEKGLGVCPTSVELWKLRLRQAIIKDQVKEVNQIFKRGILELKEKSAPLWLMTLRYHTLTSSNEVLDLIYKDGIQQPKEISNILKPEYIQWLALWKGIKDARKTYNLLAKQKPYCKELHTAMYKLESLEIDENIFEIENVLKITCEQFGNEDVDIWINMIEFYLENHKKFEDKCPNFDINAKITEIRQNAESILRQCDDALLLNDFKEKYDSVTSEI